MLRLNYIKAAPRPYEYLSTLSHYFHDCGLPDGLVELVWLRASQLNGCAYCIDMHVTDALKVGIEPRRVHLLDAWRETELYSPAERGARMDGSRHQRAGRTRARRRVRGTARALR